jgi:hypothetical protein
MIFFFFRGAAGLFLTEEGSSAEAEAGVDAGGGGVLLKSAEDLYKGLFRSASGDDSLEVGVTTASLESDDDDDDDAADGKLKLLLGF